MSISIETSDIRTQTFRKTLGRLDIIFLSIAAIISIDTVAQIAAGGGAESFTWTLVIGITFLLPYAFVVSELGSAFHEEGGPFVWVRLAFGKLAASISTMFYWITNPLWMGGSLVFISAATWNAYISPLPDGSPIDLLFKIAFIWIAIATAIVGLQYGKHIVAVGGIVKVALLVIFVVTVVIYAMQNGVHGYAAGDFSPTLGGFLAVTPVILFAVVGFEAPNGAAEEMRDPQKDVPRAVASSGLISILCYLVPIFAILAVLPSDKVQGATGLLDAFKEVFAVYGPAAEPLMLVAAVLFVFVVLTQASAWMIASDRVQAAAGADGAFFRYFGKFSPRFGTPLRMNLLSGIIATVFCVAATLLLKGGTAAVFTVVLTVAISTLLLSYLVIFPTIIVLRKKYPDVPRPFRVPGGRAGLWICTVVIYAWVLLGAWVAVFPGTLETMLGVTYDFHDVWGVDRGTFETFTIGTLVVIALLALGGYLFERNRRRDTVARPSALDLELELAGD
ncbi:APC family permease [Microbacterium sp. 13-71-7]|jgi:amino acid transporter|uniref:APC family permease n=1 Tax=Microbacterium sp. 13-71-7 TaxID=1970399 RepID=UPI000BD8427E|nr:APC family permease [Microbacterium sp. 13-71-7]OZB82391.1 MAG: amino acid permease [Microbacterium sp. 13-71-7]